MNIRTTALIAGGLGLLLLIGGLIAEAVRPEPFADPVAQVTTTDVVLDPDLLATAPTGTVTVTGEGALTAYLGRTADVDAWLASRDATVITGIPTWEELSVEDRPAASASPEPSASASASPSADASASPSADPSASPSASPEPTAETPIPDLWREASAGEDTLTLEVQDIPRGLPVLIEAGDDATLTSVSIHLDRVVDDAWITPLKWWGAVLTAVGVIALISLLVDLRGARSRGEELRAGLRTREPAQEDGRRARREASTATSGIPVVTQDDAPQGEADEVTPAADEPDDTDVDTPEAEEPTDHDQTDEGEDRR